MVAPKEKAEVGTDASHTSYSSYCLLNTQSLKEVLLPMHFTTAFNS
ncbi:MAG: hypothetical protein JWQ87_1139 [Candidatus Sulfotelmatobacter sp.]|nr:hypothetical protein [Candidatus Sulfotelmatobacter sp.]